MIHVAAQNMSTQSTWSDRIGPHWVRLADQLDAQYRPLGELAVHALDPAPDESVLDVGCGCGHTTIDLALRVSPGRAHGVDIAPSMIEHASRLAAASALDVTFEVADAQVHDLGDEAFDLLYSRFGLMFFADPRAAFTNMRRCLRDGARVGFVCWGPPERNEWNHDVRRLAESFADLPNPPTGTQPGQHSMADPRHIDELMTASGFAQIEVDQVDTTMAIAGPAATLDEAVEMVCHIGPGRQLLEVAPTAEHAFRDVVTQTLEDHASPAGFLSPVSVNVVRARAAMRPRREPG
jgi:SAM-dependent methyltransferase